MLYLYWNTNYIIFFKKKYRKNIESSSLNLVKVSTLIFEKKVLFKEVNIKLLNSFRATSLTFEENTENTENTFAQK